MHNKLPTRLK